MWSNIAVTASAYDKCGEGVKLKPDQTRPSHISTITNRRDLNLLVEFQLRAKRLVLAQHFRFGYTVRTIKEFHSHSKGDFLASSAD